MQGDVQNLWGEGQAPSRSEAWKPRQVSKPRTRKLCSRHVRLQRPTAQFGVHAPASAILRGLRKLGRSGGQDVLKQGAREDLVHLTCRGLRGCLRAQNFTAPRSQKSSAFRQNACFAMATQTSGPTDSPNRQRCPIKPGPVFPAETEYSGRNHYQYCVWYT